jgi:S-formylglutathione hydrolase FrmB
MSKASQWFTIVPLLLCQAFQLVHAQGTIINETFYSNALQENRWLKIYLPEGYDSEDTLTSYPLVVFLHGGYVDQHSYPMLFDALDDLIWTSSGDPPLGYIRPMIAVAPNGNAELFGGLTWWSDSEVNGDFEHYVHDDVVSYMDSAYNTSASGTTRALMGHSMGGYGAVTIAMRNLDVFCAVSTFGGVVDLTVTLEGITPWILDENGGSGPYDPSAGIWTEILFSLSAAFSPDLTQTPYPVNLPIDNDGAVIDSVWARWRLEDPPRIARSMLESDLGIYLHCGQQDVLWIDANRAFRDSLDLLGIPCRLDEFTGGHSDQLHVRMPLALQYFDSLFASHEVVASMEQGALPQRVELQQNYPNPFNPSTTIEYDLKAASEVLISINNVNGQLVDMIHRGVQPAGSHRVVWTPGDLPSGVYICQLCAGAHVVSRKMMLID